MKRNETESTLRGGKKSSVCKRARAYLAAMPAGVSGNGGHDSTFKAAVALVHGFALEEPEAWPLLAEFNARCDPPWSNQELLHKLKDAGKLERYPHPCGHLLEDGKPVFGHRFKVSPPPKEDPRFLGRTTLSAEDLLPPPVKTATSKPPQWLQCNFDDALEETAFTELDREEAELKVEFERYLERLAALNGTSVSVEREKFREGAARAVQASKEALERIMQRQQAQMERGEEVEDWLA